jgi:hypothetical protein
LSYLSMYTFMCMHFMYTNKLFSLANLSFVSLIHRSSVTKPKSI